MSIYSYENLHQFAVFGIGMVLMSILMIPESQAQDWRYSAGYTVQNYSLLYDESSANTDGFRSTQKGAVEIELERYLLYRLYISGKADYLVNNQETILFGGPIDFKQLAVSANLGMQWNSLGVYAGFRVGQMWNMQFRGVTGEGENAWVEPAGDRDRMVTALTGGIKYFPMRFLRFDAAIHKQILEPKVFRPTPADNFTPQVNGFEFKPYSVQVGVTVSIPFNSSSRSKERVRHVNETGQLPTALNFGLTRFSSPLDNTRVTSGFGQRNNRPHHGVDLNAGRGDEVYASASGVVITAGTRRGFGNMVEVMHRNGYSTIYAHLDRVRVSEGEKVQRGQRVGNAGDSGQTTGVHLHFEIHRDGEPVNPTQFVRF